MKKGLDVFGGKAYDIVLGEFFCIPSARRILFENPPNKELIRFTRLTAPLAESCADFAAADTSCQDLLHNLSWLFDPQAHAYNLSKSQRKYPNG